MIGVLAQFSAGRIIRRLCFAALALLMSFPITAWAEGKDKETSAPPAVGIVYGPQAGYRDAVLALQKCLEAKKVKCVLFLLPKTESKDVPKTILAELREMNPRVFVGVGTQAVLLIRQAELRVPIVFCMIPNVLDAPFFDGKDKAQSASTGVATDIDPKQQVEWLKKMDPEAKNLGVFYSPRTKKTSEAIQSAGKKADLTVTLISTDREKITDAFTQLDEKDCDAVLMLPDAGIYNPTSVRGLLLWGIRHQKAVFGFSESIVKAGGFAGQYFQPEDVGNQTHKVVLALLNGAEPKKIGLQYPQTVRRAVNLRTASLIGINLDESILKDVTKQFGKDE